MLAWHQKFRTEPSFPINIYQTYDVDFPPHWHDEIEIVYVQDGVQQVGINREVYTLHAGDFLLVGSADIHYYLCKQYRGTILILQYGLTLYDELADQVRKRQFLTPHIRRPINMNTAEGELYGRLLKSFQAMNQENKDKLPGYRLAMKSSLYDFMTVLLRNAPAKEYTEDEKSRKRVKLERLNHIFTFVEQHYGSEINLKQMAERVNQSLFHFSRFFKEASGMTFGQYLSSYRINQAEQLLRHSDASVTEIAYRCGFGSIQTFNRVFKKWKGCPPTAWRKA